MPQKIYVKVIAEFDTDGTVTPLSMEWEDGTVYEIDKVTDARRRASMRVGGTGMCYTCVIRRQERYLYFENPRWFVEGV